MKKRRFFAPVQERVRVLFGAIASFIVAGIGFYSTSQNIFIDRLDVAFPIMTFALAAYYLISYLTFRVEIFDTEIHHRNRFGRRRIYAFDDIVRFENKKDTFMGVRFDKISAFTPDGRIFVINSGMEGFDHFIKQLKRDFRHKYLEY